MHDFVPLFSSTKVRMLSLLILQRYSTFLSICIPVYSCQLINDMAQATRKPHDNESEYR